MEKSDKIKNNIPTILWYIIPILLGIGFLIYLDFKNVSIPYDDAYSIFISKLSYIDIVKVTSQDIHPPLYYWGLKSFTLIFGDSLVTFRIFSSLGVLATLILGCFPIRYFFGNKAAVSFIFLTLLFPVTQYLATDIRMYSWTMFFVLATALCAYRVYQKNDFRSWFLFYMLGLISAYLHNYGLLSVLGIYIILFFALLLNKKRWQGLLICGLLFIIGYLPWLLQLIGQIGMVSDEYWIKPLTLNDLFLHIYYFYSPKDIWLPFTHFSKLQMMVALIVIMSIQAIVSVKILKNKSTLSKLAIISFFAFLFPIVIGGLVSITYLPILVTRYMTCSFGLFVLSIAFILAKAFDYKAYRRLSYLFFFLLFIDAGIRFYSGITYYNEIKEDYADIKSFVKQDNLYVNDFSYHVMPRLQLIIPGREYYILPTDSTKADYSPFVFKEMEAETVLSNEFILVHQEREAIQQDFSKYRKKISEAYSVVDSIHASDILLYRMRIIPNAADNLKE